MKLKIRIILYLIIAPVVAGQELTVTSEFEGGSVEVIEIDAEKQYLKIAPADHPGKGWRCWWYFRVDGLKAGTPLVLDVGDAPWATPDRAHLSDDGGQTWIHSDPGIREGKKRIRYRIATTSETMWFAWGPPFTPRDAHSLVETISEKYDFASAFNLATTRGGRETPALKITAPGNSEDRKVIWFQARQHAWESGSSWVSKGLVDFLVSGQPAAVQLREKTISYVVPIMDIDNTAIGAGGKSQKPQDHNRDWSDAPHWNSVAAAQKHILSAAKRGRFAIFVDLHNPAANNRFPYYYIPPRSRLSDEGIKRLDHFLAVSKENITGPLRFTGRATESGPKYDPKNWTRISKNWVVTNIADDVISVTLETAWNTPSSTTGNYETVGKQLGETVSKVLLER